jgi:hypothetical protein
MPSDIAEKAATRLRHAQMIHELVNDPESFAQLRSLFATSNGHGVRAASTKGTAPHVAMTGSQNGARPRKYGEMRKYALEVLNSTPQTVQQILDRMVARGFKSMAKDPKPSVAEVLTNMGKRGEVKKASETGPYGASMWTK